MTSVLDQEQLDQLRRRIDAMPGRLAEARRAATTAKRLVAVLVEQGDEIAADVLAFVTAEMTEAPCDPDTPHTVVASFKGDAIEGQVIAGKKAFVPKPAFQNKEAREAETRRRLREHARYQDILKDVVRAEHEKVAADIALGQVQDEDRALERQVEMVGHEVRRSTMQEYVRLMIDHVKPIFTR